MGAQAAVATEIKKQVIAFKPNVPLVVALRNKGMRPRHWDDLSDAMGNRVQPDESFTLSNLLELDPLQHLEHIQKVSEAAAKEYNIEQALDKMLGDWKEIYLTISPYRDTGTGVLKGVDEITARDAARCFFLSRASGGVWGDRPHQRMSPPPPPVMLAVGSR